MSAPAPRSWHGTVYRHLPVGSPFGPLDTRFSARSRENWWNRAGEPTLVCASDPELLEQELAWHIARNRAAALAPLFQPRQVFAIELRLHQVFDLTDPKTLAALGIDGAPDCFTDRHVTRATAGFLRHARAADALVVPSLVHPADSTRWNLVVFLDGLRVPLEAAVISVTTEQTFQVDPVE